MKMKSILALIVLASATSSHATMVGWLQQAQGTAGNVTASTNNNVGWNFNGTSGVTYDYGALDALNGKPVDGSTVEFIFNLQSTGSSIAIGTVGGWSPGPENNVFKLEQYPNTGKFGITIPGVDDWTLTTPSTFAQTIDVVFVRRADGLIDMYINGAFVETDTNRNNWRLDGGIGTIGSGENLNTDVPIGTVYAVASYDKPLGATEVAALYSSYTAVPEPSSLALVGLGAGLLFRRRRLS